MMLYAIVPVAAARGRGERQRQIMMIARCGTRQAAATARGHAHDQPLHQDAPGRLPGKGERERDNLALEVPEAE